MNLNLGIDLPALQKDLNSASGAIKSAVTGFANDANKANDEVEKGTRAATKGFGSLQQQFRAAQKEALTLASKYGVTSQAATLAFQKAGELKDQVAESKLVIDAFSADSKFTAVARAMTAAAGAASIVTGAMGLMGVKSEETAQMLLKVQSALALTQGLAALSEMGDSFKALSAVIRVSVIPQIVAMNAAIMANPLALIVGAVVLATAAFVAYSASISDTTENEKIFTNFSNKATVAISKQVEELQKRNAQLGLNLTALKQGVTTDEVTLKLEKDKLVSYERTLEALRNQNAEREKSIEYMGVEWLTNRNNLGIYERKVNEQKNLVSELEKTISAEKQIATIKSQGKTQNDIVKVNMTSIAPDTVAMENETVSIFKKFSDNVKNKIKPISFDSFVEAPSVSRFQSILNDNYEAFKTFADGMKNLAIGAAGDLAYGVGQMLAGGDWGKNMKQQLAQLMSVVANGLMALGTALFVTNPALGAALVGGGIALKVAAGVVSQNASEGVSPTSGVGNAGISPASYTPNYIGGNGLGNGSMESRLYGGDLLITVDRAGRTKRR